MKRPLPALDVDLAIEHGGRRLSVSGSGRTFTVRMASLRSLIHFFIQSRPWRTRIPRGYEVSVFWRRFRLWTLK